MKTILTEKQILFLNLYRNNHFLTKKFYLTGGTALAEFYLYHRLSEDFDFFTEDDFDVGKIDLFINQVEKILKPKELYRGKLYDRYFYHFIFAGKETLKAEFVKYEFKNLKKLQVREGIFVNDIYDIAVNKFFAIFDRNEIKDFVDLYFLLKKYSLKTLRRGVEKKFGFKIEPIMIGGEFMKIKREALMPKMVIPLKKEELIDFFQKEALKFRSYIFE